MRKLPTFHGYTVDMRLREFRRVTKNGIEFISFYSQKGTKILAKMMKVRSSLLLRR